MVTINIIDPIVKLMGEELQEALTHLSFWAILLRLFLAVLFAGAIGFERAVKRHAAGLRTYILISLACATAMMVNQYTIESFGGGDITRIGSMAILGVAFLGAGTILVTSRNQIKGLTTAAGLWASAVMGLAIGAGAYTLSLFLCIIIVIALSILPKIEGRFRAKSEFFEIHIEILDRTKLKEFMDFAREVNVKVSSVEHNPAFVNSGLHVYTIGLVLLQNCEFKSHSDFIEVVKKFDYIHYVEELNF